MQCKLYEKYDLFSTYQKVMFNLGADKALCFDFFDRRANLECLNQVNLVIIAKSNYLECISNFWVINLINYSYKVISKVLENRLSGVINDLVDDFQ